MCFHSEMIPDTLVYATLCSLSAQLGIHCTPLTLLIARDDF